MEKDNVIFMVVWFETLPKKGFRQMPEKGIQILHFTLGPKPLFIKMFSDMAFRNSFPFLKRLVTMLSSAVRKSRNPFLKMFTERLKQNRNIMTPPIFKARLRQVLCKKRFRSFPTVLPPTHPHRTLKMGGFIMFQFRWSRLCSWFQK